MRLLNGSVCRIHNCSLCCNSTEMPLTDEDIENIRSLGYKIEEFAVKVNGIYRLRNIDNKCVFLNEKGLCKIYNFRPLGCRAYPIIIVNDSCEPDYDVCPHANLVDEEDLEVGCRMAKKVISEITKN